MALTTKNTGLVSGVPPERDTSLATIKVLAGFYDEQSQERKKGEVFQCSERFARKMIDIRRAERVAAAPPVQIEQQPAPQVEPQAIAEVVKKDTEETRSGRRR